MTQFCKMICCRPRRAFNGKKTNILGNIFYKLAPVGVLFYRRHTLVSFVKNAQPNFSKWAYNFIMFYLFYGFKFHIQSNNYAVVWFLAYAFLQCGHNLFFIPPLVTILRGGVFMMRLPKPYVNNQWPDGYCSSSCCFTEKY